MEKRDVEMRKRVSRSRVRLVDPEAAREGLTPGLSVGAGERHGAGADAVRCVLVRPLVQLGVPLVT